MRNERLVTGARRRARAGDATVTAMTEQPGTDDQTELEVGLHQGDAAAEERVRSGDLTQSERGLGPATLDQAATVEAQRDELDQGPAGDG